MQPQRSNVHFLAREIGRDHMGRVWAENAEGTQWVVRTEETDEQRTRRELMRVRRHRAMLLLIVIVLIGIVMVGVMR